MENTIDNTKITDSSKEIIQQEVGATEVSPTNEDYLRFIGGRKFNLSLISIVFTTVLCWFGKIEPSVFSFVIVTTITAYTTGNVIQKMKT